MPGRPERVDGYAPIRDYAIIGDGRTAALVARDGSIDWFCVPDYDCGSVFAAVLDAERGGSFGLAPEEPFHAERRYVDETNVLETTFTTASATFRVTDAMLLVDERLAPLREIARHVECISGRGRLAWRFEPRFHYGRRPARIERRGDRCVARAGADALSFKLWAERDEARAANGGLAGSLELADGETALFHVGAAHQEPLVLAPRHQVEERLRKTTEFWRSWSSRARYDGPWRDAVVRSALALKLCVFSPSGAIIAAPTTSLPEWIGGVRNWDYRFTWLRDASFTLDALLRLGYDDEAHAFFWWFMHASRLTLPRLQILYRVTGIAHAPEQELAHFAGYRGSSPVRVGNGAVDQLQLDVYGAVLDSVWLYVRHGHTLDRETARDVSRIADFVAQVWREPDSGIWEVRSNPTHFTQSKAMCALALERAVALADEGVIPGRHRSRWAREAAEARSFYESQGWSDDRDSYVRAPDMPELDASLLILSILGCEEPGSRKMRATVDAVRAELARGPLVYRYRGDDGVGGDEGAFLACSFWLVDALAQTGRSDEAAAMMDELVGMANDVGLFAEEVDPESRDFLGNFPQALTHLALVNAAVTLAGEESVR